MEPLVTLAFYLGFLCYTTAGVLFYLHIASRDGSPGVRFAPFALGAAAVLHGAHVVIGSLLTNICPVESLHFAMSLTALMAVGVFLALTAIAGDGRWRNLQAIGAFVSPLALAILVGAQFVGQAPVVASNRGLLMAHISANLLGVGLFLLAGAASGFYLVQEQQLKAKRIGWWTSRLPPLDALDSLEHRFLLGGFLLLTLGIVSGAAFANRLTDAAIVRAALAYASWSFVAAVLLLRAVAGWRGRRAAYGTLAGVAAVVAVLVLYAVSPAAGGGA